MNLPAGAGNALNGLLIMRQQQLSVNAALQPTALYPRQVLT